MSDALSQVRTHLRPLYWRARFGLLNLPWLRRRVLARKLGRHLEGVECSVCRSSDVQAITFFSERWIEKCYCRACQHIFSRHLNRDVGKATELFGYDRPNDQYEGQKSLQAEVARVSGRARGAFLDFGVGGNTGIVEDLRRDLPDHEFRAADIYPSSRPFYFQLYAPDAPIGHFDGISSNAVIEHLDNTVEAWRYLNRLLKPMAAGGGVMLHAFPSQLVEDLDHWAVKIASHECVFSRASLGIMCRETGFEPTGWRFHESVQHPIHGFRKVRDVE